MTRSRGMLAFDELASLNSRQEFSFFARWKLVRFPAPSTRRHCGTHHSNEGVRVRRPPFVVETAVDQQPRQPPHCGGKRAVRGTTAAAATVVAAVAAAAATAAVAGASGKSGRGQIHRHSMLRHAKFAHVPWMAKAPRRVAQPARYT